MMTKLLGAVLVACFALGLPCAARASSMDERGLLLASGVPADRVSDQLRSVDRLAAEFKSLESGTLGTSERIRALHAFLHSRVLRGKYLASASDVGAALDGGRFNCVAATILLRMLSDRCGLAATAMSTRGHVWCRFEGTRGAPVDVETTCRDWFEIAARYRGASASQLSEAMAAHRRRVLSGRALGDEELLAVLHFNRGVTQIGENRLAAAALANLQAVTLDRDCRPAWENLAAVRRNVPTDATNSASLFDRLIWWAIDAAVRSSRGELAASN